MSTLFALISLLFAASLLVISDGKSLGSDILRRQRRNKPYADLPEVNYDARQLATTKGYPFQEHDVQTKDGFILTIHRIPFGRHQKAGRRPVVFLQHGLMASSDDWMLNSAESSLAFILADAGFDVWLGNIRGNIYSRRHTHLSPKDKEFWNFSFYEVSMLDLPAMVDYVYEATGQQLHYVGHSQGTLMGFIKFANDSVWAEQRIKQFQAMAPVAHMNHVSGALRFIARLTGTMNSIFNLFGEKEFMPKENIFHWMAEHLCGQWKIEDSICKSLMFKGYDAKNINMTRVAVYGAHTPAGTSSKTMIHYGQMIRDKRLQQFDYGKAGNLKVYGETRPPLINVATLSVPTILYWSDEDTLADKEDVQTLEQEIEQCLVASYEIKNCGHLDFTLGINAVTDIYPQMLKLLSA